MKKLFCQFLFIVLSFITITLTANEISREANKKHEMIILMKPEKGNNPDKINEDISLSKRTVVEEFGPVKRARYLIGQRKKIGIADKILGLTPEEIDKIKQITPDFSLVHPDSVEARLQRYMVLTYPSRKALDQGKNALKNNRDVISAGKNLEGSFSAIPNDDLFQDQDYEQWGPYRLMLPTAWDKATGHAYIGVADSGLDINHPELINYRQHFSKDIMDGNSTVFSATTAGHGTHVTGIISALTDNDEGVAGVCWDCSIAFARIGSNIANMTESYSYFSDIGVQAINSSFGLWRDNEPNNCSETDLFAMCDEIEFLLTRDILISAAAGNGNMQSSPTNNGGRPNFIQFPAADSRTIAVGAIQHDGTRPPYSDHGGALDLIAPGSNILSTFVTGQLWNTAWECGDKYPTLAGPLDSPLDGYGTCTGTSMAAPHITGILGLMRSVDPLLDSDGIKTALFSSAEHYPTKVTGFGHGLPDAELAIDNMLGKVNGSIIPNRLTPLFSLYSATGEDSLYTTVPQMAWSAFAGTLPPQPTTPVTYQSAYGLPTQGYSQFPHDNTGNPPQPQPVAEVYIFTTKHNPVTPSQELVPLYRLSYQGSNGSNTRNTDHVYTTEQTGITAYEGVGYKLDGIEGYIFSNQYSQPIGTEKLQRRYNTARDDHAIFPENKLNTMDAAGYTVIEGNNAFIGYVYLNENADNDLLVDGFERAIGTCLYDADSDNDGKSDGDEVFDYPRTDPLDVVTSCDTTAQPQYTWKDNAAGTLSTDITWDYAMGYHFTPQVNGTIDQIGGFFNGTKIVKLFNKSTGALLGQTTVTANNSWNYGFITPVTVQAGVQYSVVAYLAGSGATVRQLGGYFFPKTFGSIRIDGSTYISTSSNPNAIPTFTNRHWMWGQADIRFTAL